MSMFFSAQLFLLEKWLIVRWSLGNPKSKLLQMLGCDEVSLVSWDVSVGPDLHGQLSTEGYNRLFFWLLLTPHQFPDSGICKSQPYSLFIP